MIYILEFSAPLGDVNNPRGQARYYIGFCSDDRDLADRLAEHRAGWGAAMCRAANQRGITYQVVATLPGDRAEERRLKRQKNTPRIVRRLKQQGEQHEPAAQV